jgi:hypothetical protein
LPTTQLPSDGSIRRPRYTAGVARSPDSQLRQRADFFDAKRLERHFACPFDLV